VALHKPTDQYREAADVRRLLLLPCRDLTAMRHWADRLVAFLFALAVLLAALPGRAATFEEALQRFTSDDYTETEAGIGEVAESGNPLAARVLAALQDGRLQAMLASDSQPVVPQDLGDLGHRTGFIVAEISHDDVRLIDEHPRPAPQRAIP